MQNSIYNPISLEVGNILKDVQTGKIGLPDLQRPFVWGNEKVRDLLDSMLRGYPIGYVMLWDSPSDNAGKKSAIGSNQKVYAVPKSLVIDGQQRLTALLSSLYGVPVRDKNFRERTVKIAYDPIARSFKNADASTERDSHYVPDVSEAFAANHDNKLSAYRRAFIKRLNEANAKKGEPELDDGGEDAVESGLNALLGLERYLLPTLEISESADEETVSDIFVRVNSQGQALKQDDFIMTLLSVYEPAMRERIEEFCAMSHAPAKGTSYNPLMTVSPTHIIRATVGVGFKRGRLRYAYQILRGRDLKTKETTPETRAENFATFGRALDLVLDLNNWHAFINTLAEAGYVCSDQVGSGNALMFCYAFYLIGRYEFDMEPLAVRGLVRRWYFAAAITGLYVGSFESEFEQQLNDVSRLDTADEFQAYFDRRLAAIMTDDYFSITLPSSLDANEATGPTWWGFVAAQVVLGAKALFSTAPLSQLLLMGSSGSKKALDKHHLFPDNYLKSRGYLSQRSNRGNFTLVDYQNNIYISDDAPSEYVRKYRDSLGEDEYRRNCEEHALPIGFEDLDYEEFLGRRSASHGRAGEEGVRAVVGSRHGPAPEGRGVAIGLAADGSRSWAGPPRREASLSLRLPATPPMGRVSSASAHAGPARRTAALDGFRKSPSLRRGRRAGPLAPGRQAPSYDAPQGRVSSASAQPALTRPGSRCPWQVARSVRARYGFRCTESSCRLRRGRTAPKSLSPKGAGTPVASRPKCSVPSPVLVLERLALKLPERPHRRRYPAQREADDEAGRVVDREAESAAVDLPHSPEGLREESVLKAPALRPGELDAVPPEPPLKLAHPVGAVAHAPDLLDPAGDRDADAGVLRALGLPLSGHVALFRAGLPRVDARVGLAALKLPESIPLVQGTDGLHA